MSSGHPNHSIHTKSVATKLQWLMSQSRILAVDFSMRSTCKMAIKLVASMLCKCRREVPTGALQDVWETQLCLAADTLQVLS